MECTICCEKFSKISHKEIKCCFCEKSACIVCYKKVILSSTEEARCIHCKKSFHLKFLVENFSTAFVWSNKIDSYRVHRENMLLDQQLVMLPETQKILLEQEEQIKYNNLKKIVKFYPEGLKNSEDYSKKFYEFTELGNKLKKNKTNEKEKEKTYYTRGSCPVDNCRGFIEEKWMCGLCKTKICEECMEIKKDNHECNKIVLENVKEIRNSTKPCPKCRARVFKIEGCYQMFCTNCNTFFDWKTGLEIVKTRFVHNPHYVDFLNKNKNKNCDDNIHLRDFKYVQNGGDLMNFYMLVNEIRDIHVERLNLEREYNSKLLKLRIKYLKNEINRKQFKELLQKTHKKFTKDSEIKEIRLMFCEVSNDLLKIFFSDKNYKKFCENINKHINYTSSSLYEIGKLYNNNTPTIHPNFNDSNLLFEYKESGGFFNNCTIF